MLAQVSVAAATAVVGYDLLTGQTLRQSGAARRLLGAGLKGSAAALDTLVRLMVGQTEVGKLYNTGTGAPNRDDMFRIGVFVPPNAEVHVLVEDAPATNPINLALDFEE